MRVSMRLRRGRLLLIVSALLAGLAVLPTSPGAPGLVPSLLAATAATATAADAKAAPSPPPVPADLDPKYRTFLEEVAPLISEHERAVFLSLTRDYQRDDFIQRFWDVRDP
ncbi:MAG: hypothetical protein JOZ15_06245, partial [Acidobacteria bacterium]|nr:hypothetical protein [Acidobacteriota bacterium]